ncbi:hypothetical protein [Pseudomonas fluorescens]|uniref:Uncharacterized protein n=1 Tax=Pseudomonas fluorescens TaxID=294 RepID=A0A5E7P627_PSEFL|nr:hypothetical protein [Pseudomonas fluorescens]VVP44270.1 hypothetical protein PS880_05010 [Pseudomonas fluorescens]
MLARPQLDAEVFLLRGEKSIDSLRERMRLSAAPQRHVYYGMALGLVSALRQAELIDQADFDRRSEALTADLGADG